MRGEGDLEEAEGEGAGDGVGPQQPQPLQVPGARRTHPPQGLRDSQRPWRRGPTLLLPTLLSAKGCGVMGSDRAGIDTDYLE